MDTNIPRPEGLKSFKVPSSFDPWAWGSWGDEIIMWADNGELLARPDANVITRRESVIVSVPVGPGEACREFHFYLMGEDGWVFDGTSYGPLTGVPDA